VRVARKRRCQFPDYTGEEEFNFFLCVLFPDDQLEIMDYNRVVADLNGNDKESFFKKIEEKFTLEEKGEGVYHPEAKHTFGMYLDGKWYKLAAKPGTFNENDVVAQLDVSILQENLLHPILGIGDPRTDKRIDFVGGIRGLGELKQRVDSGEMKMALALYPVTMKQIIDIADSGKIMPPKATWFEPKLRSGLIIHKLD
jgi:uncharacterized protein (DUF1015 family)